MRLGTALMVLTTPIAASAFAQELPCCGQAGTKPAEPSQVRSKPEFPMSSTACLFF
jgi:hypothetical protein